MRLSLLVLKLDFLNLISLRILLRYIFLSPSPFFLVYSLFLLSFRAGSIAKKANLRISLNLASSSIVSYIVDTLK